MRTYAKDKIRGTGVFPRLLAGALKLVFYELKNYPQLYNSKVLYLYGDEVSIRFYGMLGFEVVQSIPPK